MATRKAEIGDFFSKRQKLNEPAKYKDPQWLLDLRENGYAVVPSVIFEEAIAQYKARFWDWIESFGTGIDRNDHRTWGGERWPPSIRGLLQHYGIGHASFVWALRSEKAIIDVFSAIWGTDDLLVSFDGACLAAPSHSRLDMDKLSWAHLDQGPRKAGKFECVQGLVTFSAAGPGKGGLVVYKGSHLLHKRFFDRFPKLAEKAGSSNWAKLEQKHRDWYFRHGAEQVQPAAPPGSVILWDSRTVHWAVRPEKIDDWAEWHQQHPGQAEADACRMAVYVCYQPRAAATPANLKKKRADFANRRMTSHWAAEPKLFSELPRLYDKQEKAKIFTKRPTIKDEEMTPITLRLAGF